MPLPSFIDPVSNLGSAAPTLWVLIKATAILLVGLTLAVALQRSSASTRYVIWLLSIGGLLALPGIARMMPVSVPILPAAATSPAVDRSSGIAPVTLDPAPGTPEAQLTSTGQSVTTTDVATARRIPLATVLIGAWALVAATLLGRLMLGVFAVRRIVRRAESLGSPQWQELLYDISDRLGIEEAPALLRSRDVQMPFASGVRHPVIVLPAECDTWTAAQRDAVLIHELGHVRRRDMIGHTLGRIACALYWFHPLVWTAARKLRDASERACDDLALRLGARPSEYAQHLLDIVTTVRHAPTPTAAIAMARRKEFEGRMLAILDPSLRRDTASRWRTVTLSASLVIFVFAVSAAAPAQRSAAPVTPAEPHRVDGQTVATPTTSRGTTEPKPVADARTSTDVAGVVGGELPIVTQALNAAAPVLDKFIQDQARKVNVNVNTFLAGEAVDPDKRDLLVRILRTDSAASVRKVAAWGLQRYAGDASAQSALAEALRTDDDAAVRKMSAWALAHSTAPTALDALRTAVVRDADADVRETAVWGLGTMGEPADAELIGARLDSETSMAVRATAAWALGSLGARSAPRSLIALIDDPDRRTRLQAAWALSQIGDSTALPAIRRALDVQQDERTTKALLRAMVRSGASAETIAGFMNSPNPEVRLTAIRSMTGGGLVTPWPWPWPRPIVFP